MTVKSHVGSVDSDECISRLSTQRTQHANPKPADNDYNIEYLGNKSLSAQNNIVKALKSQGIQIDGVGLESHFIVSFGSRLPLGSIC